MEVLRRENGKVLKENSLLHMEIIRKDEECDERLRSAAAASRKLEDEVTELKFWKQQHIERYLELEKIHGGVKAKLDTVLNGTGATTRSVSAGTTGEDAEARMQLTTALNAAAARARADPAPASIPSAAG